MKHFLAVTLLFSSIALGCGQSKGVSVQDNVTEILNVSKNEAIEISRDDAYKIYGSGLDAYDLEACDNGSSWQVKFTLKNPAANGGEAEYQIDKKLGVILKRKAYQ
jgi:phage-related protein